MSGVAQSVQDIMDHYRSVQDLAEMVRGDLDMANETMRHAKADLSNAMYNCESGVQCGERNKMLLDASSMSLQARKIALQTSSSDLRRQVYGLLAQNKALLEKLQDESGL